MCEYIIKNYLTALQVGVKLALRKGQHDIKSKTPATETCLRLPVGAIAAYAAAGARPRGQAEMADTLLVAPRDRTGLPGRPPGGGLTA